MLKISSILKISVFRKIFDKILKKKLLTFSSRWVREPMACFYCPEMCRFSCPTAETLRTDTVTPRGKMSLLHLLERGFSAEKIAGGREQLNWFLEQCTGCGRCTEFCLHEIDVGSVLRKARGEFAEVSRKTLTGTGENLRSPKGLVFFCESGRKGWWQQRPELLRQIDEDLKPHDVFEIAFPHREWSAGQCGKSDLLKIAKELSDCRHIWVESAELAWFFAKGLKEELGALEAEIRMVWQRFFTEFSLLEPTSGAAFHESFHLSRLLPRIGYSVPMYDRGALPFHHGWNVWDCGGEGHYRLSHPNHAIEIAGRFLQDLSKDGRRVDKIVCQSLSCVEHLKSLTRVPVVYWLDEVASVKEAVL